jgi:hypothetical protein
MSARAPLVGVNYQVGTQTWNGYFQFDWMALFAAPVGFKPAGHNIDYQIYD